MDEETREALEMLTELEDKWCDNCAGIKRDYAEDNIVEDRDDLCDCPDSEEQ